MPVDARRTISDLRELRALTADDHGAQRIAWSPTWLKARAWFQSKLAGLPVEHHLDAAGNSWTTLQGDSERVLILGSHLDSVPNGGWLDGALGVLAAFEVLRGLAAVSYTHLDVYKRQDETNPTRRSRRRLPA